MSNIRVAMVGCGSIQGKHVHALRRRDDAEIVALCDVAEAPMDRLIENTGMGEGSAVTTKFTDAATMYRDVGPDAVIIATPHTMHFDNGMQALDAGCHVLMEKPMVTSAAHAHRLTDKVKEAEKVLVIGYNTPCTPEFAYLRNLIRTRQLGQLELVVGHLSQSWLPEVQGSWRLNPKLSGGGQAYDSGAHLLNSLCWTVESRAAEVFAFLDNKGTEVDVNSSINIRFENNVLASIVVSGNCPVGAAHMAYMFDGGKVEICGWTGAWINVYRGANRLKYPPITDDPTDPADNLIDAILGRAEPRTSPTNGIVHSELMDLIYESARIGRPARNDV